MFILGIDVGNYDTKSQHTTAPSGFEGPTPEKPLLASEYLEVDGKYYIPTTERFAYEKDKTRSDRCLILTLFSIAKEIYFSVSKSRENLSHEEVQMLINNVKEIALGVGLPPEHYTKARIDELTTYYKKFLRNGIRFVWNDYEFNITMKACRVYPQGGSAATEPENIFRVKYPAYFVIDIGGYTVDIIKFKDNQINGKWTSKEEGVLIMFDDIISKVQMNFDITLDNTLLEDILLGKETILPKEVLSFIYESVQKHSNSIIDIARQLGVKFKAYPVLFGGGGSLLLHDFILNNNLINQNATIFLSDPCANAKGYGRLLKQELAS